MPIKQLSATAFLSQFDASVHSQIADRVKRYGASAVVLFENEDFSSSQFGQRTALVVGPQNTYTSVEACEGKHLNDLPSQRQYAKVWCPAAEILDEVAKKR
jgi:hypothetical protein